jgi:hypothetical protein
LLGTIDADTSALAGTVDGTELQVDVVAALPAGSNLIGSVGLNDGTDSLEINADGSINVNTAPGGYGTWKATAQSVTSTESELAATPLSGRLAILVQNLGSKDIYIREQTGVSTANGICIPKGSSYEANLEDGADLYAITGSGSSDVRIAEYAA